MVVGAKCCDWWSFLTFRRICSIGFLFMPSSRAGLWKDITWLSPVVLIGGGSSRPFAARPCREPVRVGEPCQESLLNVDGHTPVWMIPETKQKEWDFSKHNLHLNSWKKMNQCSTLCQPSTQTRLLKKTMSSWTMTTKVHCSLKQSSMMSSTLWPKCDSIKSNVMLFRFTGTVRSAKTTRPFSNEVRLLSLRFKRLLYIMTARQHHRSVSTFNWLVEKKKKRTSGTN